MSKRARSSKLSKPPIPLSKKRGPNVVYDTNHHIFQPELTSICEAVKWAKKHDAFLVVKRQQTSEATFECRYRKQHCLVRAKCSLNEFVSNDAQHDHPDTTATSYKRFSESDLQTIRTCLADGLTPKKIREKIVDNAGTPIYNLSQIRNAVQRSRTATINASVNNSNRRVGSTQFANSRRGSTRSQVEEAENNVIAIKQFLDTLFSIILSSGIKPVEN